MSSSPSKPFEKHEVEEYERKRFRGIDQKIVHRREMRILEKILADLDIEFPLVLDIPCGYGRFSNLLLEQGFHLVSGDLSFHMVKRAREKFESVCRPLAVVADLKQGLPFKPESFGFILSMRFFHHLHQEEDRKAILKEFSRSSTKWVILSYYQTNFLHLLQRILRRKIKGSKTRIKMISRRQFEIEAQAAGLKIVRIFPLFRSIHSQQIALLEKS